MRDSSSRIIDLTGQIFGKLTVLEMVRVTTKNGKDSIRWKCLCDCGKSKLVFGLNLRRGNTKGCGCSRGNWSITHHMTSTRQHRIWNAMKQRCSNKKTINYHNYGGKGIRVCDEWLTFENFWKDMKDGYTDELTLDRIDNKLGYSKDNCRWATYKEQASNTRVNHLIEYKGETKTMTQWAETYNLSPYLVLGRIRKGWSVDDALTREVKKLNRKKKNLTS